MSTECVVYWCYDRKCQDPKTSGYVGVSRKIKRRIWEHRSAGVFPFDFEVKILFHGTVDECLRLERKLRPRPYIGWNNGSAGGVGRVMSLDTRQRMSRSKKGKRFSLIHRKRISEALKGRVRTREHARKIANSVKRNGKLKGNQNALGHRHTEAVRRKIGNSLRGRKRSAESLEKASQSLRGRVITPEWRARISASTKGRRISIAVRRHLSRLFKGRKFSKETRRKISEGVKRAKARRRAELEQVNDHHRADRHGHRHPGRLPKGDSTRPQVSQDRIDQPLQS